MGFFQILILIFDDTAFYFIDVLHTFFFLFHHIAYGISVSKLGIKPRPLQWKQWILTTRPPRNSRHNFYTVLTPTRFFSILKCLTVVGLCCWAWAFPSCSEQGYSWLGCVGFSLQSTTSMCIGFRSCSVRAQ